ncbi:MAG: protein kinase, partial [Planctomycetes bacterium]|nr:protein kinase [Planctomycetota bacterium]
TARATGEARWILLLGPQGVGKRRLVAEFRARFPETPVEMRGELEPPSPGAQGLWITVLPATLPDDPPFLEAYGRWLRMGRVHELYLKPFLRGQEVRLVEQIVRHAESARDFVTAVQDETGGYPGRMLEALRRSFAQGAWSPCGGSYRFERAKHLTLEAANATLLQSRLGGEEKGFRDLLSELAVLGACVDYELLLEATGRENASLYYLLNHGQRSGYLRRDANGTFRLASEALRPALAAAIEPEQKQRLLRRALPAMMRKVEAGGAPLDTCHDVAVLVREEGSPERAFRWYLDAVLAARDAYDRKRFLEFLDEARACYREVENARAARRMADDMENLLGPMGRGLGGLDRLRRLPTEVRAKITDFGIARRWQEEDDLLDHPRGTPRYMSPEQARLEELTPASDIYALGILAREMLEGRHPLRELRGRAAVQAIRDGVAASAPAPIPALQAELRELIAGMLAPAPAKRPTAREVAQALQRFQLRQAY